jgi:hypothetical protein
LLLLSIDEKMVKEQPEINIERDDFLSQLNLKKFVIFSLVGLLIINVSLISSYILIEKYGSMTLSPGEKYNVNIAFFGDPEELKNPVVCGKAIKTDGKPLQNINVSIYFSSNNSFAGSSLTDKDGKYCIILPEITSNRKFDVYVEYDNELIELASNNYQLSFQNNQVYDKNNEDYVFLNGTIINEQTKIENGRFEVDLKYYNEDSGQWEEIFDYKKYYLNIEPNEIYKVPNNELNFSWEIPSDAQIGKYKLYIKTSFNARDRTSTIYFNITG